MPSRNTLCLVPLTSLLLCLPNARGEEAPPAAETWQDAARRSGLSASGVSALEKNRVLVTDDAYKQIFSAYLSSGGEPPFITSDSLLNAYHVLYEESVLRLEYAKAAQLPSILKRILKNIEHADDHLKGNPKLALAAKKRAVLVTGIAMRLMDDSFRLKDEELDGLLAREVEAILRAEGVRAPEWLSKPDATFQALDYSRYKPRGFYTRSDRLSRYFRAVSWLQSIPFRVASDEELLAILMLGNCITDGRFEDYSECSKVESFFRAYRSFIGAADDWDLVAAAHEAQDDLEIDLGKDDLPRKREQLRKTAGDHGERSMINDQVRFAPDDPRRAAEATFRIISAYRTPSALLFQRTTDPRKFGRPYPTGLEVSAALGSDFAREQIDGEQRESLLKEIRSCKPYFQGDTLYLQYLHALKALVDAPERDAPDFMKNRAWEVKSCNTVLAGWAQLRHTWDLQTKMTLLYLGMDPGVPEGFVEPEPEFFSRMAELAANTKDLLEQAGAFTLDQDHVVQGLEKVRAILDGVQNEDDLRKKVSELPEKEVGSLMQSFLLLEMNETEEEQWTAAYFKEQCRWLDGVIADVKKGGLDSRPKVKERLMQEDANLEYCWEQFENVSRRLEIVAHKQLRQVDLNDDENAFLKSYGRAIAGIMLYGGNSYLTPRDDAPRVVAVHSNPQEGGYLNVGIARPRRLYVLYPWKGRTILCRGAVMPYYEFVTGSRLTDESWKDRLDSERRPAIPKWMSPGVSDGRLNKPVLENGSS